MDDKVVRCPSCHVEFRAQDVVGLDACPVCGAALDGRASPPKKASPRFTSILVLGIVFIVLVSLAPTEKKAPPARNFDQELTALREKDRVAAVHAIAVYGTRDRTTSPSILILDIHVRNRSDMPLKDPVIACALSGASGTMFGVKKVTLYRTLPRQSEIVAVNMNLGFVDPQTEYIECKCLDAAAAE